MRPGLKRIPGTLIVALLVFAGFCQASLGGDDFLSLPSLIEQSLKQNPGVSASAQSVEAALARVPQAGALPDPMLTVGAVNLPVDSFKLDEQPMTQVTVGVAQTLPYPGKLNNSTKSADWQSKATGYRDTAVRQESAYLVRATYHDLVFLDQAIAITGRNRDLLRELSRAAEARYSVGMGIQQDVIKAQVELSRIIDDQIGYEQNREKTGAELNRLIYAPPGTVVGPTRPYRKRPALPDRQALLAAAKANNPLVLASRSLIDRAKAQEVLARLSPYPDFTVMFNYGFREDGKTNGVAQDRPDFVSAAVTVPVPVWIKRKQDQELAEKQARLRQARFASDDVESRVLAQVDKVLAEAVRLDKQIALLETGIIPQAVASLDSAEAGYQTGKVDFITLLNNQVTLYQEELRLARLESDYFKVLAALDRLSGKPVQEILKGVSS